MEWIRSFLEAAVRYLAIKILVYDLGICVVVGLSFIFTQDLNANSYSDRMVWAGIIGVLLGGIVLLGASSSGMQFGVPPLIKKPEEAKRLVAHENEIRMIKESRYDAAIQIWVIGLFSIGIGALVQILLSK